jgi:preprotein translocase subunit SecE
MSTGKLLTALAVFALLFWLINHWFYWLIAGLVLSTIVSENIDPDKKGERIRLSGFETVLVGVIGGLVLYGIDRLFAWAL